MNPEHWQRVKDLLNSALELGPAERTAYLRQTCGEDAQLCSEVQSLLASYEEAGDEFMDGIREEPPAATLKDDDPFVGMRIGPYRVIEELGHGGMGTVFRAVRADDAYRKQVAIKVVRRGMDHDFVLRRFRHERQIMATLEHPNIAHLLDGGATEDGLPYFVMEYVQRGQPIDTYCDENKLNTRQRLVIFQQVCSAVQAAHERKIIHRDIKPSNILINSRGEPKLLDFGIAKILDPELSTQTIDQTMTVLRVMTPEYASPEQVRGEVVTEASDVYSLGVLLYELLTGHRPYRLKSRTPQEIAQVICETEPERPSTAVNRTELVTRGSEPPITLTPESVGRSRGAGPDELRRTLSGDLDNIVLTAMRKEPTRRYPTAAELSQDIQRYLEGLPVRARKTTSLHRVWKYTQRNRTTVLAVAIALIASMALTLSWRAAFDRRPDAASQPMQFRPFTSLPGDETQPVFSADGQRIAFVWTGEAGQNSDIYVRSIGSSILQRITTHPAEDVSPSWSPDGQRIAFLRATEHETSVFLAPVAGGTHGKVTVLYPNRIEAVGRHLAWSPDGKFLAAADKNKPEDPFGIVLIEVTTGHKIHITFPGRGMIGDSSPAFSPDNKRIAFIRASSSGVDDLYVVPITGGEARRITQDRRFIISATWSADGKSILFSSNRSGGQGLWRVPVDTVAPAERIFVPGENASDPVLSPDGKQMAYSQFYVDSNIWEITRAGEARRLIASTQYDSSAQFSPDGTKIAFRSLRSGSNEIWIADSDGRNEYQLTSFNNSLTGSPRWSPDGRTIACDSRPEGQPDIYFIDVATRKARKFSTSPAEDVVPSFSRDGKWVYFGSNRSGAWQIWRKSVETGASEQVTQQGGFAAFESPDRKYLYYAKGRSVGGLWRKELPSGPEGPVVERLKAGYWGYWALCRDQLFYIDRERSEKWPALFRITANGPAVRIAALEKPIVLADSGLAVTDDCSRMLITQTDQSGSDIMIGEIASK